jgi:hypothetical protein
VPQTEITSLQEATPKGKGPLLVWRLAQLMGEGLFGDLPSLCGVNFLRPKAGGWHSMHTPPLGRGLRSRPCYHSKHPAPLT